MRPREYQNAYTVVRETKYCCNQPDGEGHLPKMGLLQPGRVLWLRQPPAVPQDLTIGYLEGVGMVEVNTSLLHRT